jgi:CubicO group peptidase (beta-lactamase class C family)
MTRPLRASKHLSLFLLAAACWVLPAAQADDHVAADQARAQRVVALMPAIDKMYAELVAEKHLPGLVYGVVLDGKLVYTRSLGYANVEARTPVTSDTRFRIASMTKSFVAMAALRLRDAGKLDLDAPVARYLPELAKLKLPTADSPPLTVRNLMTMTTGLPEDNPWGDRQMAITNAQLEKFVGAGLSFSNAPGTAFEYSNLGFVLLGKVVSKAAGMRFQDYVTRNILLPLGMKETVWEYAGVPADKLALGYRWDGKTWELEPMLHDGDGAAMGGLITTMNDFARYVAFHLDAWPARDGVDAGPVRRATVREQQMPRVFAGFSPKATLADGVTPNPKFGFYAYGLNWARDSRQTVTVSHSGGLPGFGSQYLFAPDHGIGIIAFTNLRYGPVYGPTNKVFDSLIQDAALPARAPVPAPVLLTRQQQVVELIQSWDQKLAAEITAENFFLDRSREDWMVEARDKLARIGKVQSVSPIRAENRLRGSFVLTGDKGTADVAFTLTPEKEPKVQALSIVVPSKTAAAGAN